MKTSINSNENKNNCCLSVEVHKTSGEQRRKMGIFVQKMFETLEKFLRYLRKIWKNVSKMEKKYLKC